LAGELHCHRRVHVSDGTRSTHARASGWLPILPTPVAYLPRRPLRAFTAAFPRRQPGSRRPGVSFAAMRSRVSLVLFLCLFASQSAGTGRAPAPAEAAGDLDVSTAAAGQLRTITGLAAGIPALALGAVAGRIGLGRQLLGAAGLLALGSLASAAAPSFW